MPRNENSGRFTKKYSGDKVPDGKKRCTKCGLIMDLSLFSKNQCSCKACQKKYFQENREKKIKQSREYYEKNREKLAESKKRYYEENKEFFRIAGKKYRENNSEECKERCREYYRKNKDALREKQSKYNLLNKERVLQKHREYYEKNREKSNEKNRLKRIENPEQVREKERQWREKNPEKVKESKKKDYSRHKTRCKIASFASANGLKKKDIPENLLCAITTSIQLRDEIKKSIPDGYKICSACHAVKPISDFHIRPERRGGVRSRCKNCESSLNYKCHKEVTNG